MRTIRRKLARFLWFIFKDYCYIAAGKHLVTRTPWFKISIFGEKITTVDYTEFEIMELPK